MKEMMTIKKILFLFSFLLDFVICNGQVVIPLQKSNGVFTVPCSINGMSGNFVFDTGASNVTISMKFANMLYNANKLSKSDIIGVGASQIANGQIIENVVVRIKKMSISGLEINNIEAVVIDGQNAPMLLGLSAIQKLGKITISGEKLIIDNPSLNSLQIVKNKSIIDSYIYNDEYQYALSLLKELESQSKLDYNDLYNLALCYAGIEDYNKCIIYCKQWLGLYEGMNFSRENEIYFLLGRSFNELKDYIEANNILIKAVNNEKSELKKARYYGEIGLNCLSAKRYEDCVQAFDLATQSRLKALNYSITDLLYDKVHDEKIGTWLQSIGTIYAVFIHDDEKSTHYSMLAAKCGNKDATDFCNHFNIKYK